MKPIVALAAPLAAAVLLATLPAADGDAAETRLPEGFVFLRDVDPTIRQEIKYASVDNFTGRPLPGYDAPECVLKAPVAAALARVQASLAPQGLGLKVYDCYRPARAVGAMARWSNDGAANDPTKRFFPRLAKDQLFALGYIAERSGHSQGNTVDLTIVVRAAPTATAFDPTASYGICTGPAAGRAPDDTLDMGTGFDCFDEKSHTAVPGLTPDQRQSRDLLLQTMQQQGFANYDREWWHFSLPAHAGPGLDAPIPPRTARD